MPKGVYVRRNLPSDAERIWPRVKAIGFADESICWEWQGNITVAGYGAIYKRKADTTSLVHRIAYKLAYGAFDPALFVCHRCDNPKCVRPCHLFLGTSFDNVQDKLAKDRQPRGQQGYNAKLTVTDVERILTLGEPSKHLAVELGVSRGQVQKIRRGERWTHLTA